jgi:hypothetical protein
MTVTTAAFIAIINAVTITVTITVIAAVIIAVFKNNHCYYHSNRNFNRTN